MGGDKKKGWEGPFTREAELKKLSSILVRQKANSVLLVGAGGVGCTAICLGLQALKTDKNAPFDIVSKRIFWLDTDRLFSSGDSQQINASFQKVLSDLGRTPESVLIVEDTRDFMEAARNSGNAHFVNALTLAVKTDKTQVILEVRDEDLELVLKWHSDIRESYTLMDVQEPEGEHLVQIVQGGASNLARFHEIMITEEAVQTSIDLTTKYRVHNGGLSRAQPERAISLLDRALASYRLSAHQNTSEDVQKRLLSLHDIQITGEAAIRDFEDKIAAKLEEEKKRRDGGEDPEHEPNRARKTFATMAAAGGMDSPEIADYKRSIANIQKEVDTNRELFQQLTREANCNLKLDRQQVLTEFSRVSGISVNKLGEDDIAVLRRLESDLSTQIFGQDEVIRQVADGIKVAKVGRRNKNKPLASYMFLGPSGVGKTEVAKVLSRSLLGDERALTRFDMSEYMEKHAAAKLIGAPPGYEGFEAGGILTNAMRKNRNRILLFDEIEKAHDDVFNIFLQVLDEGRLTDNVGRTVSFDEAIIIMTTNTGQPHFLSTELSFETAKDRAIDDLNARYRSEFLNRFAGRQNIICFNRLGLESIEKIVRREVSDLDRAYSAGSGIGVCMDDVALASFCADHYDPSVGARGLPGYMQAHLEPALANFVLNQKEPVPSVCVVGYDTPSKRLKATFRKLPDPLVKALEQRNASAA